MEKMIITPWDGKNEHLLERCKESVVANIGELDATHVVVRCDANWEEVMFAMRNYADMIAWVDADDIVMNNSLEKCFNALENSDVGMVFTDEVLIDLDDNHLSYNRGDRQLLDIASQPGLVHHLVVTKKNTIDEEPLKLFAEYAQFNSMVRSCPLDWLMRARCASKHGMMRVPIDGYGYRQHEDQITKNKAFHDIFEMNIKVIRSEVRKWIDFSAPCYTLE